MSIRTAVQRRPPRVVVDLSTTQIIKRRDRVDGTKERLAHLVGFSDGITDQPEHRGPKTDKQRPPFSVTAFVLIDGLRADPQTDAQPHRAQRCQMQMGIAETDPTQRCG
jgi:hypothetical protein